MDFTSILAGFDPSVFAAVFIMGAVLMITIGYCIVIAKQVARFFG